MNVTIQQARDRMKRRSQAFKGTDPKIYKGISQDLSRSIDKNFSAGGRQPKWKLRTRSYSHPILDKTGEMKDRVLMSARRWIHSGTVHLLRLKSTGYGFHHQYGCGKLPIRKFVKFNKTEIKTMGKRFAKVFHNP